MKHQIKIIVEDEHSLEWWLEVLANAKEQRVEWGEYKEASA